MSDSPDNKTPEQSKLLHKIEVLEGRIDVLERLNGELVEQNKELIDENRKNGELLAFLPSKAAEELKIGKAKSLRYKMVTVLFADIKGFTKLTEQMDAQALIDELDRVFYHFDEIVTRYNIEKIKSIGDTYMAAGGIPKKNRTNPIEVIMAALEMVKFMKNLSDEFANRDLQIWDMSIGIHTGPVIAGVLGKKKISYEIKGDTVNIAHRIEASCKAGKIYISSMTYEFVKDYFVCEYGGKMPIKYKGHIDLYAVKGFRPELSINGKGIEYNKKFKTKFQLIQYDDIEEYMLDKLERELPKHLYYHNLKHTIDVTIGVEIIGRGEGVSDEELLLLKTAALFHDSGQIVQSKGHEEISCDFMREVLPKFNYDDEQIDIIEGIIMATQLPPEPKTTLQKIICDADLDYLGRRDFIPVSDTLYRELKVQGIIGSFNEWNKLQVKFLSVHQYFTKTALNMRQVSKDMQVERIKSLIIED